MLKMHREFFWKHLRSTLWLWGRPEAFLKKRPFFLKTLDRILKAEDAQGFFLEASSVHLVALGATRGLFKKNGRFFLKTLDRRLKAEDAQGVFLEASSVHLEAGVCYQHYPRDSTG